MAKDTTKPSLTVLLGAGASQAIGLPSTESLSKKFLTHEIDGEGALFSVEEQELLKKFIEAIKHVWNPNPMGETPGFFPNFEQIAASLYSAIDIIRSLNPQDGGKMHGKIPVEKALCGEQLSATLMEWFIIFQKDRSLIDLNAFKEHLWQVQAVTSYMEFFLQLNKINSGSQRDFLRFPENITGNNLEDKVIKQVQTWLTRIIWFVLSSIYAAYQRCSSDLQWMAYRSFWKDLAQHFRLDIVTTNYDHCVEKALEEENIPYTNGIDVVTERVDAAQLDRTDVPVRIAHVHGSCHVWPIPSGRIQEFAFEKDPQEKLTQFRKGDLRTIQNQAGRTMAPHPVIVGLEKTAAVVNIEPYASNFDFFSHVLKKNSKVLIVGYGFGDEHINQRLELFLSKHHKNFQVAIASKGEAVPKSTQVKIPAPLREHVFLQHACMVQTKEERRVLDEPFDPESLFCFPFSKRRFIGFFPKQGFLHNETVESTVQRLVQFFSEFQKFQT